jgi:hypothetical protein
MSRESLSPAMVTELRRLHAACDASNTDRSISGRFGYARVQLTGHATSVAGRSMPATLQALVPRLDGTGIITCWGIPQKRLMELSFKAPEVLTKREAIEKRDLEGALRTPPSLADGRGRPVRVGNRVNFPSGSAAGGRRIGRVVKLGKSRLTVEYMFKSGRKTTKTVPAVECFKLI